MYQGGGSTAQRIASSLVWCEKKILMIENDRKFCNVLCKIVFFLPRVHSFNSQHERLSGNLCSSMSIQKIALIVHYVRFIFQSSTRIRKVL